MSKLKKSLWLLAVTAAMLAAFCGSALAAVTIELDGYTIPSDVAPRMVQGRTCVPVRVISETLGASVLWKDGTVTIKTADGDVLTLKANSKSGTLTKANKEYQSITLDVPAKTYNGRLLVPLRVVAEAFGITVDYQSAGGGKVILTSTPAYVGANPLNSMTTHTYMTMGGWIYGFYGNGNVAKMYNFLKQNRGAEVAAPEHYSRLLNLDIPMYYLVCEYSFYTGKPDIEKPGLVNWTIYQGMSNGFPDADAYTGYLLHDEDADKWYKFNASYNEDEAEYMSRLYPEGSSLREELLNNVV